MKGFLTCGDVDDIVTCDVQEIATISSRAARLQGELDRSAQEVQSLQEKHEEELKAMNEMVMEATCKVAVVEEVLRASKECLATEQARLGELEVRQLLFPGVNTLWILCFRDCCTRAGSEGQQALPYNRADVRR